MAALQESGSKHRAPKEAGGGMKPCESEQDPSSTTSMPAEETRLREVQARASATVPKSAAARLADVTVEDAELLDCGVCCLPLKRPIFECDVGHMICSLYHDKLKSVGECHKCRITGSYRRCHGMEDLVESIRVPCPHASHGCAMRLSYYDQDRHDLDAWSAHTRHAIAPARDAGSSDRRRRFWATSLASTSGPLRLHASACCPSAFASMMASTCRLQHRR